VTIETLGQAWPQVLDAVKAKRRVAAIVIGNASLVSLDEAVLTLRFPRQGDVKGFVHSHYEDLLKQVINGMFGINVVVRAITGGGDMPAARRAPQPPGPPFPSAAASGPGAAAPSAAVGDPGSSRPASPESGWPAAVHPAAASAVDAESAGRSGGATGPFGSTGFSGGDLPAVPLPPGPDDDEDFDPDDEDMSVAVPDQLTGMALVQRELGGQVIAEYED
jgi:DNA polymerase-3 subunit gamma/tau